jgi:hypothetical protein
MTAKKLNNTPAAKAFGTSLPFAEAIIAHSKPEERAPIIINKVIISILFNYIFYFIY